VEQKSIDKLSIKFKLESFGKPLPHSKKSQSDQSINARESGRTLVRFCDKNTSDSPRYSRSRRFYLWIGEEFGRICEGSDTIYKPRLVRPQPAYGTGYALAGEVFGISCRFWLQIIGLNPFRGCICQVALIGESTFSLSSGKSLFVYLVCRTFSICSDSTASQMTLADDFKKSCQFSIDHMDIRK
jgi:hypothetical protein